MLDARPQSTEALTLSLLSATVVVLAILAAASGVASCIEAVSFVTGAICVWLTVNQNVWNFPVGLVNVATFSVVFFRSGLYADAGLQIVYFVLGVIGWYLWLCGGENRSVLKVSRATLAELIAIIVLASVLTLSLWQLLYRWGGSASFWDSLTTSLSLASQWLLNKKRLESWVGWIVVDLIYVPLYLYKELNLTAILYGVFLVMAIVGLRRWRHSWRTERLSAQPGTLAEVSAT